MCVASSELRVMSVYSKVVDSPVQPKQPAEARPAVNGRHHADWLTDPADAWAREPGPYSIWNADLYLEEEPVELYNGWLVHQEMTHIRERTVIGTI